MKQVAQFYKVSKEQFLADFEGHNAAEVYESIQLPKRATTGFRGLRLLFAHRLYACTGRDN